MRCVFQGNAGAQRCPNQAQTGNAAVVAGTSATVHTASPIIRCQPTVAPSHLSHPIRGVTCDVTDAPSNWRSAAKLLSKDEAQRIAAYIATLPEFPRKPQIKANV